MAGSKASADRIGVSTNSVYDTKLLHRMFLFIDAHMMTDTPLWDSEVSFEIGSDDMTQTEQLLKFCPLRRFRKLVFLRTTDGRGQIMMTIDRSVS